MKRVLALAFCALAAAPVAAQAQRVSKVNGNRLLSLCSASDVKGCDAYVAGVADALAEAGEIRQACIPVSVTTDQLRDVLLKYLHNEPENREMPGGRLAVRAFTKAWPCHK
jgi:hypothetical protein